MTKDYSHLTEKQREQITDITIEETILDAERDRRFCHDICRAYIEEMTLEEQLEALSSDVICRLEMLGFDPETGVTFESDEAMEKYLKTFDS